MSYYEGNFPCLDEKTPKEAKKTKKSVQGGSTLQTEEIAPPQHLPPLLLKLTERKAERLHWIGTSFGFTPQLFTFWAKNKFIPVYMRQTINDITGEHSTILLRPLTIDESMETQCDKDWCLKFNEDFRKRFLELLGFEFSKSLSAMAALTVFGKSHGNESLESPTILNKEQMDFLFSPHDLGSLPEFHFVSFDDTVLA